MMNAVRPPPPARRRALRTAPVLGPAFVAAIAYVDPGNFATNFAAGSEFGYLLLWVIVAANVTAMLIQSLSAKLGPRDRPQPARGLPRHLPAPGQHRAVGAGGVSSRSPPTWPR